MLMMTRRYLDRYEIRDCNLVEPCSCHCLIISMLNELREKTCLESAVSLAQNSRLPVLQVPSCCFLSRMY